MQQHLTGLVEVTQQYRELFEESSIRIPANHSRFTQRNNAIESLSCAAAESQPKPWSKDWKSKVWATVFREIHRQHRIHWTVGRSQPHFDSRCLCWWPYCYIDIIRHQNTGTSNQPSTTSREWPRAVLTKERIKAASKLAAAPSTRQARTSKTQVAVHNSSIPTTSFTTGKYRSYSDSPWFWRTQKEGSRGKYDWQMASPSRIQKMEIELQKRILSFFAISQSRYATAWWSSGC